MTNLKTPLSAALCAAALALPVVALLAACGSTKTGSSDEPIKIADAAPRCASMASQVLPSSAFRLPANGAKVSDAVLIHEDPSTSTPAYCRVRGAIAAAADSDPPINFQLNLPSVWNGKAVQLGGAGFNGVVVSGTGNVPGGGSHPTPLQRGFVTFGGDSGHSTPGASFYLNAQATLNYSGESVRRTMDAASSLISAYYKAKPRRTYYIGMSKGGQEALHATQRYASDYDGAVAYFPAVQSQALVLAWFRMWEAAFRPPTGALLAPKQTLLKNRVLAACDSLDGATDGIVSNVTACRSAFDVSSLRCPGGADTGSTCLSDLQIAALRVGAAPMTFAFPLANGTTGIGGFPVFTGGDLLTWMGANFAGTDTAYFRLADGTIRYAIQQIDASSTVGFDYQRWHTRIEALSSMYDANNSNLDQFMGRGGRLLILQGTTDMLVPESMTTAYVERLRDRYGARLQDHVRYYVVPGYAHGTGDFNVQWDSLSALDVWVESGRPPASQTVTDLNAASAGRTRPLCEAPNWPRYRGSGDVSHAENFTCASN